MKVSDIVSVPDALPVTARFSAGITHNRETKELILEIRDFPICITHTKDKINGMLKRKKTTLFVHFDGRNFRLALVEPDGSVSFKKSKWRS